MSRDAPAFDFYAERWTHGTRHMSKVERCDYLDLLLHQWTNDGLPDDLVAIARLLGYRRPAQIPALVLEKFPVAEDGCRRNARLEVIRAEQRERIQKNRDRAVRASTKRWRSGDNSASQDLLEESSSNAQALLKHCLSNAHLPTTHHSPQETQLRATPSGEIPVVDLPTCLAASTGMGVTAEVASVWWHECDGRGWLDGRGLPIMNWRSALKAYFEKWRANEAAHAPRGHSPARPGSPATAAPPPPRVKDYTLESFQRISRGEIP